MKFGFVIIHDSNKHYFCSFGFIALESLFYIMGYYYWDYSCSDMTLNIDNLEHDSIKNFLAYRAIEQITILKTCSYI